MLIRIASGRKLNMDWYTISNINELDTPALVVYPDRVRENIRRAIEMVGDPARLRPHVKTHKSPQVTRMMLEAGIQKFKCATIAEAEMLALEGAPDVLLAYQPIGPKVGRLIALIQKFPDTTFSCLIDSPEAARAMSATFFAVGLLVPVWLDINVGMDRTGIAPGPAAAELYRVAAALPGIAPVGLHAYDGHIRDSDPVARAKRCDAAFETVLALRKEIVGAMGAGAGAGKSDAGKDTGKSDVGGGTATIGTAAGAEGLQIIAGGSPTFPIHARRAAEIQCSPGTFVYWDKGYGDQFPDQPFEPAALVVTRVISLRGQTRLCLDLGHKSISAENEISKRVGFINGPELTPFGQSEEHLVVDAKDGSSPSRNFKIGDVFYGVPYHICPTVALYDRACTVENGKLGADWRNIARDRKLSI
jgi:D-serine deaminase-like pyridoxal phosphate-dependent protein